MKTFNAFMEQRKCPPGMKWDSNLKDCVPSGKMYGMRWWGGVGRNQNGENGNGSGNGNGHANGHGNGANGNGNGGHNGGNSGGNAGNGAGNG